MHQKRLLRMFLCLLPFEISVLIMNLNLALREGMTANYTCVAVMALVVFGLSVATAKTLARILHYKKRRVISEK
jgi:hypothetical protein